MKRLELVKNNYRLGAPTEESSTTKILNWLSFSADYVSCPSKKKSGNKTYGACQLPPAHVRYGHTKLAYSDHMNIEIHGSQCCLGLPSHSETKQKFEKVDERKVVV